MKKFVSVLLLLSILFSLSACASLREPPVEGIIEIEEVYTPEEYTYGAYLEDWQQWLQKNNATSQTTDPYIVWFSSAEENYYFCKVCHYSSYNLYEYHETPCGSAEFEREYTFEEMLEAIGNGEKGAEKKYYYSCSVPDREFWVYSRSSIPSYVQNGSLFPFRPEGSDLRFRWTEMDGIPVLFGVVSVDNPRYSETIVYFEDFAFGFSSRTFEEAKQKLHAIFDNFEIQLISKNEVREKGRDAVGRVIKPSDAIAPAIPVWAFVILAAIALLVIGAGVFVIVLFAKRRKKSTPTE